jgi:hypothetical protein
LVARRHVGKGIRRQAVETDEHAAQDDLRNLADNVEHDGEA